MGFAFDATANGHPISGTVFNTSPIVIAINGGTATVSTDISTADPEAGGAPVTGSISVSGTAVSDQQSQCLNFDNRQMLFGFEDSGLWTSNQGSLSKESQPLTQGCSALGVSGQGYMTIASSPFSTTGLTVGSALSLDLYVPRSQPNPFWQGQLQLYASCPSGNLYNQFVGQSELTALTQNKYSTLRIPVPSYISTVLSQPGHNDCTFSVALNVNQTGQKWLLDNLRFSQ
jgi:hypothetical protein